MGDRGVVMDPSAPTMRAKCMELNCIGYCMVCKRSSRIGYISKTIVNLDDHAMQGLDFPSFLY